MCICLKIYILVRFMAVISKMSLNFGVTVRKNVYMTKLMRHRKELWWKRVSKSERNVVFAIRRGAAYDKQSKYSRRYAMPLSCKEKILSEEYVDFVIDFPLDEIFSSYREDLDYCYQEIREGFGIISINRNQLADTSLLSLDYHYFPDLLGLQQDEEENGTGQEIQLSGIEQEIRLSGTEQEVQLSRTGQEKQLSDTAQNNTSQSVQGVLFNPEPLIASGITQVQDAALDLTGRGVILAFADTGINFENRVFRKEDGSSRILAIWDQTLQDGEPPEGFIIGTEYTREQINEALTQENPRDYVKTIDEDGHGTRLAALSAGSIIDGGAGYLSPAYNADILVVKLKPAKQYLREYYQIPDSATAYATSDIMMAIKYLDSFARAFRRPIVFCLGMGSNYRDHEGNSVFSRYLNTIASSQSRIMVITGGNEGNAAHHFAGDFTASITGNGSQQENMEIFVSEGVEGFLLQIWTSAPTDISVSIRTPGGEYVAPVSVLFQENLRYRFVFEETVITVYNEYIAQGSGDALVLLRFEKPTPGIWTVGVSDMGSVPNTRFDAWLPITDFMEERVYFLESNPNITLTAPAYVADAITVSTYNSANNSIYLNSGRGYSREGQMKPDFAAPGVAITIAGNRLGRNPLISTYTGASLAAAITAGAAAQFMQWAVVDGNAPFIRSQELKNYFIRGARREASDTYPNRIWGYGRLDLYGTFVTLRNN